jgi:transposase
MPKPGLRRIFKYSEEFKSTAVALSHLQGVLIQDVAQELDIHPFMLSRWRKQVREGTIVAKQPKVEKPISAELVALRKLKKDYARLKEEHEILKKSIRFISERRRKSSSSSTVSEK